MTEDVDQISQDAFYNLPMIFLEINYVLSNFINSIGGF